MPPYTVYVIQSREGYLHTGYTDDLVRRLEEHNRHDLSFWTKRGTGWRVVHKEEYATAAEAMEREKWLKSGIGREFLKQRLGI
jgi:putative endonuclease